MPSVSKKQHNLMAMVANDPKAAKRLGIPQSVGQDFTTADKGRKFGSGGADKAKINKQNTRHGKLDMPFNALNKYAGMAKGGDVKKEMKAANIFAKAGEKKLAAHERREAAGKEKDTPAIAKKEMSVLKKAKAPKDVMGYEASEHADMGMKKGGKVKKYAEGGNVNYSENEVSRMKNATPENTKRLQDRARKAGATEAAIDRATKGVVPKFAKGGGVESKGKTKGRFV